MANSSVASGCLFAGVLALVAGCGEGASEAPTTRSPSEVNSVLQVAGPLASAPSPGPSQAAGGRVAKPDPPLSLAPPPEPSPIFEGTDLKTIPAGRLAGLARQFYDAKQFPKAAQFLHYAIQNGGRGAYDLACNYALTQNTDAAFYWLQKAGVTEGVDAKWAEADTDLTILRKDARWSRVAAYFAACNAYWAASGHHATVLVVPEGYTPDTPIGVLVAMHGRGGDPRDFVSKDSYQGTADAMKMAVVGVSGTVPLGEKSFDWSEDPARDAAQVRRALSELADRLTVARGSLVAFGFSQGAQAAFEVAFANPSEYQGAIVMSAGPTKRATLRELTPSAANTKQGFVCTCGAQEQPGNVFYTRADSDFARKAGCRVELKLYEGVKNHSFPSDFKQVFPAWVRFVGGENASR